MTLGNRNVEWWKGALLVLIWVCTLFLMTGCGTLGKAKDATLGLFGSKGERVKQRIALVPFANRTPWDENQTHSLFMAQLVDVLEKKCPGMVLVKPGDADYPETLRRFFPPAVGTPDNIGLSKTCRESGLNGVITGQLSHISAEEKKRGLYGFRKWVRVARIKLDVVMYHSGSAAKLMDDSFSFDAEMVVVDGKASTRKWVINDAAIHTPLIDCANTAAKTICEKISETPWEAPVLAMDGEKAVIAFGDSAGLLSGDTFEVYSEGRMVEVAGGYRYILPGVKIGEAKISAIFPRKAEVTAAEGVGVLKVGNVVRLKK
jgi:hypothetical protein